MKVKASKSQLNPILFVSILIQIAEGYWYYILGNQNCGTQLKLSCLLTGCIVCILSDKLLKSEKCPKVTILYIIGNCSFGIYYSHMVFVLLLRHVSFYSAISPILFPIIAITILMISLCLVLVGKKVLGKYSKYFAF